MNGNLSATDPTRAIAGMRARVGRIEALIHRDVGRGMEAVFAATQGGLWQAGSALAEAKRPSIGLITGFFVPDARPPSAETDGPAGAALLARGFVEAGLHCRVATDAHCRNACEVALRAAGAASVSVRGLRPDHDPASLIAEWRAAGVDWVIAIERCGPSLDGTLRNMRGVDISAFAGHLHQVFSAGPWRSIAIGDGGNEIGMGCLPRPLVADHVPLGNLIGCVMPADALITAGVSHWGAYGLLATLAVMREDWTPAMLAALDPALDGRVIEAMVRDGPAVDGVTLRQTLTVDGLALAEHHAILQNVRNMTEAP